MAVTQYIGARYVPLFADPAQWSNDREYEPLTVVLYQGASYTSRQAVPIGIDITNTDFWVLTGNYNAQVEQYRQTVLTYNGRIIDNENAIADINERIGEGFSDEYPISRVIGEEIEAREAANGDIWDTIGGAFSPQYTISSAFSSEVDIRMNEDAAINAKIGTGFSDQNTIADAITDEVTNRTNADDAINAKFGTGITSENTVVDYVTREIDDEALERETADNELYAAIQDMGGLAYFGRLFYGQESVGFGDSNMVGEQAGVNHAYRLICDKLGCNYHNYGVNSATFSTTTQGHPAILEQVNGAPSEGANNVKLVVVIGGINDYHYAVYNEGGFATNVANTLTAIHSKYPNAVILAIFDQGRQLPNALMLRYNYAFLRTCNNTSFNCMAVPICDLALDSSLFASQNHWNESGSNFVANRAIATLLGGGIAPIRPTHTAVAFNSNFSGISGAVDTYINPFDCHRQDFLGIYGTTDIKWNNAATGSIAAGTVLATFGGGFSLHRGRNANQRVLCVDSYTSSGVENTIWNFVQRDANYFSLEDNPLIEITAFYAIDVSKLNGHHTDINAIFDIWPLSYNPS